MDEEIWTGLAATGSSTHDLWAPETKAGGTLGHPWVPTSSFWPSIVEWLLIQVFGLWAYLDLRV